MDKIIEIEITNTECKVVSKLDPYVAGVLREKCSFAPIGSEYMANFYRKKRVDWDGVRRLYNIQTRRFPVGLLALVTSALGEMGFSVKYTNKRNLANTAGTMNYEMANFQEREYQTRAVRASVAAGNGIIKAATGSGKTTIAARTIGAIQSPTVFIVHTRDLLYQTIEAFDRMFPNEKIGQVGDGVVDFQNITVATVQSLAILGGVKYESQHDDDYTPIIERKDNQNYKRQENIAKFNEYRNNVGVVMFDEVQLISSQSAFNVRFLFDRANYAFGYSASPWRDDGSDLMIEAAFGARICDITASELIDLGYLVQPTITVKQVQNRIWTGKKYEEIYKSAIVDNAMRNIQVISDAWNEFKQGKNTLVLVTRIAHGETLEGAFRDMNIPAVFISGKSRMKDRRRVIHEMREGKKQLVIASTIADVGLDVPRLESIVEAGAGKSSVTALQRLGRIMRPFPGKTSCHFITYRDTATYIKDHVDKKIAIWRTEPRFIIEER